ncbi:MAG: DUF2318 domain-containing protein [Desulfuromonadales bacterium]|nr:DUF2318 domain-containing protein [Desulfuromonadales bacterium]
MIIAAVVVVAAAAGIFLFSGSPAPALNYVTADAGKVSIPLADVNDGKAHYYKYKAGDRSVSFFLLKSRDGSVRAALDACDVCYKSLKGYRQEGNFMVCNNCNQKFESNLINVVKGGCNPAPLTRTVANGQVVLHERELIDGRRYFPNNS